MREGVDFMPRNSHDVWVRSRNRLRELLAKADERNVQQHKTTVPLEPLLEVPS